MSVKLHHIMARPKPSRWRRSVMAIFAIAVPIVAFGGCSEGYDVPGSAVPCAADGSCPNGFACGTGGVCIPVGDFQCSITGGEPSQGDMCTQNCIMPMGCASMQGTRACTCVSGIFVQCACLPPERWPYDDVPVAPYCDSITGRPTYLGGELCTTPGQQCASTDEPGRGCVCQDSKVWLCGDNATLGINPAATSCESFGSGKGAVLTKNGLPTCAPEWDICISRDYNATGTSPRGCICNLRNDQRWYCGSVNRWIRAE